MSKLNPQKATAYVGPGVLRKGGKITPVPNGPLIKKKGIYAGSTLKAGGKVKKAMMGSSIFKDNPIYEKTTAMRGKLGSAALGMPGMKPIVKNGSAIKKAQNGKTTTTKTTKKPIPTAILPSMQTLPIKSKPYTDKQKDSLIDSWKKEIDSTFLKKNDSKIKKAQNGTSEYSDPKPLFDKIKKSKDSLDNAMFKLEEKKFKSKTNYLKGKLKNEQSIMNSKKAKVGAMIKRKDGSTSRRGLWDNIRANKGSGKKPTAAMLKQERKIKAKK